MILTLAMLLDAWLGEPDWLWRRFLHPAVTMGRGVAALDARLNHGAMRRARGVAAILLLVAGAALAGLTITAIPDLGLLEIAFAAILLAQRSLVDHVRAVARALRASPEAGREAVSRIVGRDTRDMDAAQIARAAIESAAENLSDGVIAPIFWYMIAGLPGMMVYKVVNTADSMIGYRTPRHEAFGRAAARLDDVMNWMPARLTALVLLASHGALHHLSRVPADARRHRSPNAGWPEAALAPILGLALAGPRSYDGRMQDFPWVNAGGRRTTNSADIDAACAALWRAWGLVLIMVAVLGLVGHLA
ncbi:adenosylcobinamide-phosphate synthase CbiB [uncultured Jannaschia sp.]|uniref:adenosylcobinamide-phosphate synthase CbiB n=1 Tax=uncultured Jannaschia sp. TaxID=293347 RepID=UPI0026375601|nr:adenosylcobinamide-phosphate synthase CbiB [uncultured Jannaschia sp.]